MPVKCHRCGQEWPRDPALEVKCPQCNAGVGVRCRRPSGHYLMGCQVHASRDRLALERGVLQKCPGKLKRRGKYEK